MTVTRNDRIYGNRLGLTVEGVDYWADIASYELAPSDKDAKNVTFADAYSGATSQWTLKIEAIVSTVTGSFWSKVWAKAGSTVPFILAPHGNLTATPGKPHFTGKVKIKAKPGISSEAGDEDGAKFTVEWDVDGEPAKVESTSKLGTGAAEETTGGSD